MSRDRTTPRGHESTFGPTAGSIHGLGIRLQQLSYLEAVGRHGNFGAAAEEQLVSQSALSQGLQRLEQSVGAALFERVGRHQHLTAEGRMVLSFARRVLNEATRLDDQLQARRAGTGGTIRLGLIDAAALYLLRAPLERFRAAHPDVRLRLTVDTSGQLLDQLDQFRIDLAIVVGPPPNDTAVELVREPLHIYGPPTGDPLEAEEWILYPGQSRTRRYIEQGLHRLGVNPRVTNEIANPSVTAQLVRLGEGWTVLPAGIAESVIDPLPRRLESVAERPILAVRRPGASDEPLIDALIAALAPAPAA